MSCHAQYLPLDCVNWPLALTTPPAPALVTFVQLRSQWSALDSDWSEHRHTGLWLVKTGPKIVNGQLGNNDDNHRIETHI